MSADVKNRLRPLRLAVSDKDWSKAIHQRASVRGDMNSISATCRGVISLAVALSIALRASSIRPMRLLASPTMSFFLVGFFLDVFRAIRFPFRVACALRLSDVVVVVAVVNHRHALYSVSEKPATPYND